MPLTKIILRPGLNREGTNYANEGGFYDGDKIRFRSGFPEKLGGWIRLSQYKFWGVCRSMWNWATLAGYNYLGIGTNLKYYVENGGQYYDITPVVQTLTLSNALSTGRTTLAANVNATTTTLLFTASTNFPPQNGYVKIDNEVIFYNALSSNTATNCVRGFNNTTAASHTANANVSSAFVKIFDGTNNANTRDYLILSNCAVSVGGLANTVINGEHQILSYGSAVYYFLASTSDNNLSNVTYCTSSASNVGGNVTCQVLCHVGLEYYVNGNGWGAGTWGQYGWGNAAPLGVSVGEQLVIWTNDNYGQDLVFAQRGGQIFYWDANLGTSYRGKKLSDLANTASYSGQFVPYKTLEVLASDIQRFVFAFGANSYDPTNALTDFDPMLVRWSDQENPYQWVPDITNQAGEFRLSHGSYIVTTINTRQEILVLTDSTLYSMQYLGPPYIWGFQVLMDNVSVMGPNTVITVNNITYWMGGDKFYMYSGRVETLPCALRQYIFADINKDQSWQVSVGSNEGFNEIWWFYCSTNSVIVDKYVIYNYLDRVWYYGTLNRTFWLDSGLRQTPMGTFQNGVDSLLNSTGCVVNHELGTDDASTATSLPIYSYVQSSDFDIGDGHNFGYVWRMLPDVNFNGSNVDGPTVTMELQPRQNSGSAYGSPSNAATISGNNFAVYPQYTVQEFTGQIYTRIRARQMAMKISSDGLGVTWQLGAPRIDIRPDGRRS
jgi:hypothetical protein